MSVRRPGTMLGEGKTEFDVINSAGEVRSCSPIPLPESSNLKALLQSIKQKDREPDKAGIDEVHHGYNEQRGREGTDTLPGIR